MAYRVIQIRELETFPPDRSLFKTGNFQIMAELAHIDY